MDANLCARVACNRVLVENVKSQELEDVKIQESGDKKKNTSHKTKVPGCLNQCSDCGATEDEKDFRNNGCGTASHSLVYLPNYDEVC
jgi:hypothetical protein